MKVEITSRGTFILGLYTLDISLSVIFPSPLLMVSHVVFLGYLVISYWMLRNLGKSKIDVDIQLRNSILYRGETEIIHFRITNKEEVPVPFVDVSVELPPYMYFINTDSHRSLSLQAKSTTEVNFPFLPTARGGYKIGPLKVSIQDGLKIFTLRIHSVDSLPVRVFPKRLGSSVNHTEMLQTFAKMVGIYASKTKGIGSDFHGLRDYIRGDPSKIVYWAASARRGNLISKEFEEEKMLTSYVILQGGTTMRGAKFDFLLGVGMDLYQGITEQNQPCGFIFFDDDVKMHFEPSTSKRDRMRIWSELYSLEAKDEYANYQELRRHILKKRITNSLLIIIGDLENDPHSILSCIRGAIINKNAVIFLDVWGYQFSYKNIVLDTALHLSGSQYGVFLKEVMNRGIEQEEMMEGLKFKEKLHRLGGTYGYFSGPGDNVVMVLKRALFSRFGRLWRMI